MSEEYGPDFVSVTDDEGNEFELEHLGTLEYSGQEYMAFVPADMDEDDEDFGLILLKVIEQDGESLLADIDDEEDSTPCTSALWRSCSRTKRRSDGARGLCPPKFREKRRESIE